MTKTIILAGAFAAGASLAAQAQVPIPPNIYSPSPGFNGPPIYAPSPWHPSVADPPVYGIPEETFRRRTCVPAAGDRRC